MKKMDKGERGIERDEQGRITAVKLDAHVLDPESPEAVQIPIGSGSGVDAVEENFGSLDDALEPALDANLKVGDQTEEILAVATKTHGASLAAHGQHAGGNAAEGLEGQLREAEAEQAQADAEREDEGGDDADQRQE